MRQILDSNPPSVYTQPEECDANQFISDMAAQLARTPLIGRFSYIYDYRVRALLFVSQGIEEVLGASPPSDRQTVEWLYDRVHPDDAPQVAQASVLVNTYIRQCPPEESFSQFVMAIDYRLRHAAGYYLRVLRQNLILERDLTGAVITTAAIYTDISHHKLTQDVRLHVNRPDFSAFVMQQARTNITAYKALSSREQQVASLVLQGLTSSQIAAKLHTSVHTVNTHRRNMRHKLSAPSYYDLLCQLDKQDFG
ncbi:hypothetical protein GCM10023172_29180 [Hymenobacter ginsengisoli]|uniref:HTH luxR-type domain-containing protein n=2 Tax=Hymenobacteraceae TaxID=1853232 RepID=A0ABP8QK21_9BACT